MLRSAEPERIPIHWRAHGPWPSGAVSWGLSRQRPNRYFGGHRRVALAKPQLQVGNDVLHLPPRIEPVLGDDPDDVIEERNHFIVGRHAEFAHSHVGSERT